VLGADERILEREIDIFEHHVTQPLPRVIVDFCATESFQTQLQRCERTLELVRNRVDEGVLFSNFDDSSRERDHEQHQDDDD